MTQQCSDDVATLRKYAESLNRAIATGARSVTLGGQTVIYNTTESLIMARNEMLRQLAAAERCVKNTRVSRQNYAVYSGRGYD